MAECPTLALIQTFDYDDPVTGDRVSVSVSPSYSKLTINRREYFFVRETGKFDGAATIIMESGPILTSQE